MGLRRFGGFLRPFICVAFPGSLSAWALPEPGTPAPPLHITQPLQAPPGASADWSALRGKAVVLEFWATWWAKRGKLLLTAYDIPKDRLILANPLPEGIYHLHTVWATGEEVDSLFAPFLQSAIQYGLNLRVQWTTVSRKAYVLKPADAGNKLLTPTAMANGLHLWTPLLEWQAQNCQSVHGQSGKRIRKCI